MYIDIKHLDKNNKDELLQFITSIKDFYKEIEHIYENSDIGDLVNQSIDYNLILLALMDKELIGFMTLHECFAIYSGGKYGVIDELYVKPDYRSDGIGNKFISFATEIMVERKWTRIEVTTPEENKWKRTVNFYSKEGFNKIGFRMKLINK